MTACGGFALIGFPLDDMWHRLFGQDVTLWGPTHLMLIGGASLATLASAILIAEGARAATKSGREPNKSAPIFRRALLAGAFLVGLSTVQAEFDFSVPQFRLLYHPVLLMVASSVALVAARIWIGRGGALMALAGYLVVRGFLTIMVGVVFGQTLPHFPLYAVEALMAEAAALLVGTRRPVVYGAVAGLGIGTFGLAAVGIVVAWHRIRGRQADDTDLPQRIVLAVTLVTTVLIALSSTVALPADGRVSNHAYPRYIAFLMPIFVMLGILAMWRVGRRRAFVLVGTASVLVLTGLFLVLARETELRSEWFHPFDTPEVSFLTNTWNTLPVAKATAIGLGLLVVFAFVLSAPVSPRLAAAGLVGVLALNVACMGMVNANSVRSMVVKEYSTAPRLVANLHIGPHDVIASSTRVPLGPMLNHQREIYWGTPIEFDDRKSNPPSDATVVIAPWFSAIGGNWHGERYGWQRVAGDPQNYWTVWFRDGDPRLAGPIDRGNGR
jgi:hypothetical protein